VAEVRAVIAAIGQDFADALDFIFHQRESVAGGVQVGGSQLLPLLGTHLQVTAEAVAIACLAAMPVALCLGHLGRAELVASTAANLGRAVPSFAVLVFFSAYLGFGVTNLVFAMVLLAIPPIFTNTYVGVRQVEADAVDAARGMGMTGPQVALRVELPLALPLVLGGVRTSIVNVVATATLGPYVGVVTLGDPIINANVYGEAGRLGAAIVVAVLAVASEIAFAAVQRAATPRGLRIRERRDWRMRLRSSVALLAAGLAALSLAACGDEGDNGAGTAGGGKAAGTVIERHAANASKPEITIGSKNFTEEFILGEIYAQSLRAAGYRVKTQLNLGSEQIAYKAVKGGQVDAYPEYTGTALTSFFKIQTKDVPKEAGRAYQQAKASFARQGLTALPPTPFTDSNGFAMTSAGARKAGGAAKLSDLTGKASSLVLAGPPECRQRLDCKLGLEQVYGLRFKRFIPVDLAKRHEVLKRGQADLSLVFTTDGQIKADKLVLLADDKSLFPPYNVTLVVRDQALRAAGPDFAEVIGRVQKGLTTPVMQELNSRVDLDKEPPARVAAAYLREAGYLR
jgi:glycine betaine/choline ABC-type transport system substrate-binding protein/ABC-type proline/glycine betaine transport system permease subunit